MATSPVDLIALFDRLQVPPVSSEHEMWFAAQRVASPIECHVGKDRSRRPTILVRQRDSSSGVGALNYALENLRVEHGVSCRIVDSSGIASSGPFTILQCLSDDRGIHDWFLRVSGMLLEALPHEATFEDLSIAIRQLIDLFQAIRRAPSRSVMGLWAELFVIVTANEPLSVLRAWHIEAEERSDFSDGPQRLEVKCSGERDRRHYFSLEQLCCPTGCVQLIASLCTNQATGGTTLGQLWDRALAVASADAILRLRIESVCASVLGNCWQEARHRAYDLELAVATLRFYDSRHVPKVNCELPPGVSEVRFRSDLELIEPINRSEYVSQGRLFAACLSQ